MAYNDTFRVSAHAVITNSEGQVLLLKANYGSFTWSFPGGALEPGETFMDALLRECMEEIGQVVVSKYLSGIYFHEKHNSQAAVFRCELSNPEQIIKLSDEHSEFNFFDLEDLNYSHQSRARDCLFFDGDVKFGTF